MPVKVTVKTGNLDSKKGSNIRGRLISSGTALLCRVGWLFVGRAKRWVGVADLYKLMGRAGCYIPSVA